MDALVRKDLKARSGKSSDIDISHTLAELSHKVNSLIDGNKRVCHLFESLSKKQDRFSDEMKDMKEKLSALRFPVTPSEAKARRVRERRIKAQRMAREVDGVEGSEVGSVRGSIVGGIGTGYDLSQSTRETMIDLSASHRGRTRSSDTRRMSGTSQATLRGTQRKSVKFGQENTEETIAGQNKTRAATLAGKGVKNTNTQKRWWWPLGERIFLPDSRFITVVNFMIFCAVVVETISTTLNVVLAYWYVFPSSFDIMLAIFSTLFFSFNIYLNHHTAVLDGWVLIDQDLEAIKTRYRKRWFVFDALTAFPWDLCVLLLASLNLGGEDTNLAVLGFRIFQLIRLARLIKIPKIFVSANPLKEANVWLRMFTFMFWLVVAMHSIVCVWMFILTPEELEHFPVRGLKNANVSEWSLYYITTLYWTITILTTVGFGDFSPLVAGNRVFCILIMLLGVLATSWVIAQVSSMVLVTDEIQLSLQARKRRLSSLMVHYKIPFEIQKDAFAIYPTLLEATVKDYNDIIDELPPILRDRIDVHIKTSLLATVPILDKASPTLLTELCQILKYTYCEPDTDIISAGEIGKELFLFSHGLVELFDVDPETGDEIVKGNIKGPAYFGENALYQQVKRRLSVRTVTKCDIYLLDADAFRQITTAHPDFQAIIEDVMSKCNDEQIPAARTNSSAFLIRTASGLLPAGTVINIDEPDGDSDSECGLERSASLVMTDGPVKPITSPRELFSGSGKKGSEPTTVTTLPKRTSSFTKVRSSSNHESDIFAARQTSSHGSEDPNSPKSALKKPTASSITATDTRSSANYSRNNPLNPTTHNRFSVINTHGHNNREKEKDSVTEVIPVESSSSSLPPTTTTTTLATLSVNQDGKRRKSNILLEEDDTTSLLNTGNNHRDSLDLDVPNTLHPVQDLSRPKSAGTAVTTTGKTRKDLEARKAELQKKREHLLLSRTTD